MTKQGKQTQGEPRVEGTRSKLGAEFLGTFALVFIGAGSVIMESHTGMSHLQIPDGKVGLLGIAFAHGLILAAMICAVGSISGGHFNPAVSFAMWTRGKLKTEMFTGYILAQFAAASVAGLLLAGIFPDEIELAGLGTPSLAPKIGFIKGIVIEAVITFFLVTTVLFVTRDGNSNSGFAGLAIGFTLVTVILFAGPLTGGSANPARYLGPALGAAKLGELLVYFIGPLCGAAVASIAFWFITEPTSAVVANDNTSTTIGSFGGSAPADGMDEHHVLPIARSHFDKGNWLESAQTLVPLLWEFDKFDRETRNSVRSILMVIESEAGELSILDGYRDLIYQRS